MLHRKLAEKLIAAGSEPERKFLLNENKKQTDTNLALALKEICYESWTTEPTKAQKAAQALKSLLKFNPNDETEALFFWVTGISDITRGKLESAVTNLDKSAARFRKISREYESAQTQVAKLIALALLGRYEDTIENGKNALKIFEKYGDELAAGKIEMNLGNTASRQGRYVEAKKFFLAARTRFARLGDKVWLTMCENNLAIIYSALNDFRQAEKLYAEALRNAREAKMFVTEAEIEASMGNLAMFRGKYDDALRFLELSRQKYEELKMPHQTAIAELEIADIYAELNLGKEAFEVYEKIADRLHKLKLQGEEARARTNFGRVAASLQERNMARKELKKAARLYLAEKNKIGAAVVKCAEANLELTAGNYESAFKLAEEAEQLLETSGSARHKLTAKWLKSEALGNLEKYEAAENLLGKVFAAAMKQEQPNLAQICLNSLGKLALQKGDTRKAERYFKKAVVMIETLRAPLAAEEFRMAFLADKLAPFENLAKIYLSENKLKKAFSMVEQARSRSLAESLSDDLSQINLPDISPKLSKKLKTLREELNWFYSRLNRAGEAETENLQGEAKRREKEIAETMRQIESTKSGGVNPRAFRSRINGQADEYKRLQNHLGEKKALIEFVNFDGKISVFAITDKKIHFITDLAKEDEIVALLENLQFQFGALRYGAKNLGKFIVELKKRADSHLRKLYKKLIEPFVGLVENRDLIVVPVGSLHYVPFHALYDGGKYLIETREVVYSPSAAVWQSLNEKPERNLERVLLIGFADEKIPLVNREIEAIQKIFGKSKVFTGEKATFAAYTENAPKFDVLHLACHGQFRAENPLFSSLHLADGWITVRDICSQKLQADLVTLSACETGLNKIFAGDEILGLARGFLSAGANSLVLSLWTVSDEATTELMKDFYENLQRGASVSASLRLAQVNFIKRNSHPYFWSPFALIGR